MNVDPSGHIVLLILPALYFYGVKFAQSPDTVQDLRNFINDACKREVGGVVGDVAALAIAGVKAEQSKGAAKTAVNAIENAIKTIKNPNGKKDYNVEVKISKYTEAEHINEEKRL